ncbi:hypothetical protein C6A37_13565, partial [Desulfobacteraceae bacterium SEEP-SAG9]
VNFIVWLTPSCVFVKIIIENKTNGAKIKQIFFIIRLPLKALSKGKPKPGPLGQASLLYHNSC